MESFKGVDPSRRRLLRKVLGIGLGSFLLPFKSLAQFSSLGLWKKRTSPIQLDPIAALASADINASQSSFTFTGLSFGDEHPNRRIFACFAWRDSATISDPVSATIGGMAATLVCGNGYETTGVCIFGALVPAGTSGDVVINYGEAISYGCSCTIIRFVNVTAIPDKSLSQSISKGTGGSNPITPGNLTSIPAKSYVIAIGGLQNTTSDLSWSTLTELFERNGANGFQYCVGYKYFATAQASFGQSFYGAGSTPQCCAMTYIS